ncbi:F0F1 ATP synthase subunit gamma [Vreelandella andesensis]|uniref:F0F1 ATP synthase subunit gamma n=1 Tax=Vreelandella andesensis TaxID=447567 RepID=A0A433KHG7_9GAMM|nr:FoF1 ATP synthase subunit gamma [Halomonas andesensis]RUR28341.1 F0F1 ATP synthase subunit gamma [Halomonas andesensis]
MTERLADISARIEGIRQLGAVMNAMKGIAASRAQVARTQMKAVDSYAATIATAISSAISTTASPVEKTAKPSSCKRGLLVFCAEQGFAGAFSERVLDSIAKADHAPPLFIIGTRGYSIAAARGLVACWSHAMPARTLGIPKLADDITKAIYREMAQGKIDGLDVIFTTWTAGRSAVIRQTILPIDSSVFPPGTDHRFLIQLPIETLISDLSTDYFHAMVCKAALHAFSAENEARMAAMSAAGNQIEQELEVFQATLRRVRQETITAEIIELGTGFATVNCH